MLSVPVSTWIAITNLGDTYVIAPLALLVTMWIVMTCSARSAFQWLSLLGAGLLLVGMTKVAFLGWGLGVAAIDFTGLSGHAMFSAAVCPLGFYLLASRAKRYVTVLATGFGVLLSATIALSRYVLHAHSASESVSGWLVGTAICASWLALRHQPVYARGARSFFAVATAVIVVLFHGRYAPTQQVLTRVALDLSGRTQPFVRVSWLKAQRRNRSSCLMPDGLAPRGKRLSDGCAAAVVPDIGT